MIVCAAALPAVDRLPFLRNARVSQIIFEVVQRSRDQRWASESPMCGSGC